MLIPSNERFPAVDAVAIVTVNNARHCYMLQVTINKNHGVTGQESTAMVKKIVDIAGGIGNCAFIYVLPQNSVFAEFTNQSMPQYKGRTIPQYKIALKQNTDCNEPEAKKQNFLPATYYPNNSSSISSSGGSNNSSSSSNNNNNINNSSTANTRSKRKRN